MTDYLVIYEQGEDGGWGAHSPDIDGVFATGATREEVEGLMKEGIVLHLNYLKEQGIEVPSPAQKRSCGFVAA